MKTVGRIVIITAILSVGLSSFFQSRAQDKKLTPTLESGIGQYKHENYEEALSLLKEAREGDPSSTLAAYYLGLNYKKLQDYKNAAPHLRDAVTNSPKIKGALVELIDCLYNLGELDEAGKWIIEAENEGIRPAQVAFLKGLVLLKEEDISSAISSFEKAKELDEAMTQACNYQIGIAHLKQREFNYAENAFKEVLVRDPSTNVAQYANEYINVITRRKEAEKPWKFSFRTVWEYDDNVVLKPGSGAIATNITDEADSRQVYTASAEYNHRFNDEFGIKSQYLFYYAKQNDLGFYDTLTNTIIIQPNLYFEDSSLAFPTTYSHSTINDTSYLSSPSTGAVYNFNIGASCMGQVYLRYSNKDYRWATSMPDEDRDADELVQGLGWYRFFAKKKGFFNLRYEANREWTDGNNWDYIGNRLNASLLIPVLEKLNLTLSGGASFQRFLHSHTTFFVQRKDDLYAASALFAYRFCKDSELQLQYTYIKNDSNLGIYTYDRNIYSAGIQLKF
ncbi:tetratricopeptide repeat protein [Candidatus Omnitrophota bacterium]